MSISSEILNQSGENDDHSIPIIKRPHIYDGDYFEIIHRDKDLLTVK